MVDSLIVEQNISISRGAALIQQSTTKIQQFSL